MKHLRQYIKKVILLEAMQIRKSYEKKRPRSGMVTEFNHDESASIEYWGGSYHIKIVNDSRTIAKMQLSPIASDHGYGWQNRSDCYDEYSPAYLEVGPDESRADHGYGPLMYDIALEYAFQLGMYIVPDRTGVSGEASNMWRYYKDRRPDVRFDSFGSDHPCFFNDYELDEHLNGAYYKPNREFLDSLGVETP